jgi:NAD(P)-dependent dehydrogenase (short-subunit alcohol dehydrogenase family)
MVQARVLSGSWGLILGGSSGMGLASAKKLAAHGMNLLIVHRDRKGSMQRIEADFDEIRAHGVRLVATNADALSSDARQSICSWIADNIGDGKIKVLLHSIALGNLKPAAPSSQTIDAANAQPLDNLLNEEDFQQTVYNMGTSLLFWVQDLHKRRLFDDDARVLGLTSEGNQVAWRGYAAVSAAKCALESVSRAIAKEFAPHGIRCNILQPGITDTPALRLIPGSQDMKDNATRRNPFGRLTTPEDVANVVYLLSQPEAAWINGALVRVDGGEAISN